MVRRRRFLVQVALLGTLGMLAFPGEGLALRPMYFISLTSSGPTPSALETPAGLGHFVFTNSDTVTHTVVFANGLCSMEVAAGSSAACTNGFTSYVGDYPYTVDGTSQGSLVMDAVGRSVSLRAARHSIRSGSVLTLHGRLQEDNASWSPPGPGSPQPVIVLGKASPCPTFWGCKFHQVAVVRATVHPRTKNAPFGELLWQLRVRPSTSMIFLAEANYQPKGGQVWAQAWSEPFVVHVRG